MKVFRGRGATIFAAQSIVTGLVSDYKFDETGGSTFADDGPAGIDMAHQGTWTALDTASIIQGDAGTSAFTDGTAYATIPANQPGHDLAELTISFYYQRVSSAAKHILFASGNSNTPGSFSIEVLANGTLRGWHVDSGGTLQFFESTNGIAGTNLALDTAHRIDLRLGGSQGARISLDGVTVASIPSSTNGWNNSLVKYLGRWTDGIQSAAVGIFDRLRIWNKQLDSDEIAELAPAQAIPTGGPISVWNLNETSTGGGVFADSGAADIDMTIVDAWQALDTDSMVSGLTGTSAYTEANGYATVPASEAAHDLSALTLSIYYQRSSSAAKHIVFACGDGSQAGDFSIEVLGNGALRGWHVGQDATLRFFQVTGGVAGTNLVVGTAYRIDITMGSAGVKLYLDGSELTAAAIPGNTNAWNNSRVKYLARWTDGTLNPARGAFDHIRLWDRQLSGAEIATLPAAVSISFPGAPAGGEFTLAPATNTTFAGLTHTKANPTITLNDPSSTAIYSLAGTVRTISLVNPPGNVTWDGDRGLVQIRNRLVNGGGYYGGAFICPNMTADLNWDSLYQSSNGHTGNVFNHDLDDASGNYTIEGIRLHGGFDGIQFGQTRETNNVTILRCICTMGRDDFIENDTRTDGLLVSHCFCEGMIFYSSRNPASFDGSNRVNTFENCVVYLLPIRISNVPNTLMPIFKLDSKSQRMLIRNCVFGIPSGTLKSGGSVFGSLIGTGKLHAGSEGNTICLLGGQGSVPNGNPDASRFSVLTGSAATSFWNNAYNNVWAAFPGHRFNIPGTLVDPAAP